MTFENDIPFELAQRAHAGTSFVPEDRAASERAGYASTLASDYASLAEHATTDEKRATLEEEFARYRQGYRKRYLAYLGSRARCMSTMITGGSNFPVERMRKRNDHASRKTDELIEFRKAALAAILKTLHPEWRPIMAGDGDAQTRLAEKIAKAEQLQAVMKAANVAIRKHARAGEAAQIAALMALGHSEGRARDLLKRDFCGRIGFAAFELTNNQANIRRLRGRLTVVARDQATEATEIEGQLARLEDCPADNRVRLYFPGKPAADVRARLGAAGFRWTRSMVCWQAYRNDRALAFARREAGIQVVP